MFITRLASKEIF